MSLTMLFGSFIAGASSEGGGAVAFPVMTLIFKISPMIARDFSLLIQSFGMSCASYSIWKQKIVVEFNVIKYSLLGGFIGQAIGFIFLDGKLNPVWVKVSFTSIWLSFALVLFLVNKRKIQKEAIDLTVNNKIHLFLITIVGGLISAITGSGIDILTFSYLVLFLSLNEKIATPTSVILMAINSVFGVLLKFLIKDGISMEAYQYWLVCLPIVIFGAPLGSLYIVKKSRGFLIKFLQISIFIQFIFSWIILDLTIYLKVWSLFLIIFGFMFWYIVHRQGLKVDK